MLEDWHGTGKGLDRMNMEEILSQTKNFQIVEFKLNKNHILSILRDLHTINISETGISFYKKLTHYNSRFSY